MNLRRIFILRVSPSAYEQNSVEPRWTGNDLLPGIAATDLCGRLVGAASAQSVMGGKIAFVRRKRRIHWANKAGLGSRQGLGAPLREARSLPTTPTIHTVRVVMPMGIMSVVIRSIDTVGTRVMIMVWPITGPIIAVPGIDSIAEPDA